MAEGQRLDGLFQFALHTGVEAPSLGLRSPGGDEDVVRDASGSGAARHFVLIAVVHAVLRGLAACIA